ncbi:hypothetical protein BCR43DRAFT_517147 [Syncephalastrum racemosum]|uniref:Uncharacterized protein n=1 Tax=Syncephalastrum racemosum TaxID=13706 RepID=A0A1X2H6M8_SYNRA|nr:hypothetical protein BCR43DRAFT_517147 [Syncephalastrum racemosum]
MIAQNLYTLVIALFLIVPAIEGYCVYNRFPEDSGTTINVRQHTGFGILALLRRFHKEGILPGQKECCPWDYNHCNANYDNKFAEISFVYDIVPGHRESNKKKRTLFDNLIWGPVAGGSVVFRDGIPNGVEVFDPDMKPIDYKYERTVLGAD